MLTDKATSRTGSVPEISVADVEELRYTRIVAVLDLRRVARFTHGIIVGVHGAMVAREWWPESLTFGQGAHRIAALYGGCGSAVTLHLEKDRERAAARRTRREHAMRMMRTNSTLLAAILLLFGAAACGPTEEAIESGDAVDVVEEVEEAAPAEEMEEEGDHDGGAMEDDSSMAELPTIPTIGETVTTDSGLQYEDINVGDGAEAVAGSQVAVHYSGFLEDGTMFDSSVTRGDPFVFPLGAGAVIKGWDEGVAGMMVGGRRTMIIPPDLGYGANGAGNVIPGGATLIFDVELLEVLQ